MKKKTVKEVKMHTFLVCACQSQDFAQSQKVFARSHDRETVTFRNSVLTIRRVRSRQISISYIYFKSFNLVVMFLRSLGMEITIQWSTRPRGLNTQSFNSSPPSYHLVSVDLLSHPRDDEYEAAVDSLLGLGTAMLRNLLPSISI